ncbi:MAG: hypothetical protein AABX70_02770 [Nanoarchaeota archaeon]
MDEETRQDAISAGRGNLALAIAGKDKDKKKKAIRLLKMTLTALGALTPKVVERIQLIEDYLDMDELSKADENIARLSQDAETLIK